MAYRMEGPNMDMNNDGIMDYQHHGADFNNDGIPDQSMFGGVYGQPAPVFHHAPQMMHQQASPYQPPTAAHQQSLVHSSYQHGPQILPRQTSSYQPSVGAYQPPTSFQHGTSRVQSSYQAPIQRSTAPIHRSPIMHKMPGMHSHQLGHQGAPAIHQQAPQMMHHQAPAMHHQAPRMPQTAYASPAGHPMPQFH